MTTPIEHEHNRLAWNEVTPVHNSHKGDQAAFFRNGGSTLFPEEIELLGDVRDVTLLHLQCNCGQDSLSIARMGADVTGVDISDDAVAFAKALSSESGIRAQFVRSDVCDYLSSTRESFDRVLVTYGCLTWLKDLSSWASGIESVLNPAGRLVLIEFHPAAMCFDEDWRPQYPYSSSGTPMIDTGIPDYVGMAADGLVPWGFEEGIKDFQGKCRIYEFAWGVSDVLNALLGAGMSLIRFEEYPFCNGARLFNRMENREGRRYFPAADCPQLPLMYGAVFESRANKHSR